MQIGDDDELPVMSAVGPTESEADQLAPSSSDSGTGYADDTIVAQVPLLKRYALALTRSADLAEELVQDCVTRALSRRHLFRRGMGMRPWLFTIMHNLHVNSRRQAFMRATLAAKRGGTSTEEIAPNQEHVVELSRVSRALDALPQEQRHVMLLVVVQELSYREAAEALGIPVGTVMSRLARGRERIRDMLDLDRGVAHEEG